ncbi:hypothetical protein ACP0CB_02945, partial [Metamycoplasma hominis]|uniref:hypothetical protein n=1 Tax=Metamycoplasma hominis TaxID=2098 RepID=UPI003CECF0EC
IFINYRKKQDSYDLVFFFILINPTFFYAFKKQLKSTKRFEIIFLFAKIYCFLIQAILLLISIGFLIN